MKAAVFRTVHQPLTIEDVDISAPGPHEVCVRTAAAGVCHSDVHFQQGLYPVRPPSCSATNPLVSSKPQAPRCAMCSLGTTSLPVYPSSVAIATTVRQVALISVTGWTPCGVPMSRHDSHNAGK